MHPPRLQKRKTDEVIPPSGGNNETFRLSWEGRGKGREGKRSRLSKPARRETSRRNYGLITDHPPHCLPALPWEGSAKIVLDGLPGLKHVNQSRLSDPPGGNQPRRGKSRELCRESLRGIQRQERANVSECVQSAFSSEISGLWKCSGPGFSNQNGWD